MAERWSLEIEGYICLINNGNSTLGEYPLTKQVAGLPALKQSLLLFHPDGSNTTEVAVRTLGQTSAQAADVFCEHLNMTGDYLSQCMETMTASLRFERDVSDEVLKDIRLH